MITSPWCDIWIYWLELPGLWLLVVVETDEGDAAPVSDAGHELVAAPGWELRLAAPHRFGHLVTQPGHAAHGPVESSNSDHGDSAGV